MPPALPPLAFPLAELVPDPANARRHGVRNMEAVRTMLAEYGWRGVIVAEKTSRVVRVGNARLAAALELGWTHGPVLFVEDGAKRAASYAVGDNRSAELAEWDADVLGQLLEQGVELPGFEDDELAELLAKPEEPEAPEEPGAYYTGKIEAPIYEPTAEEPPPVSELCDTAKASELMAAIGAVPDLPPDVVAFLRLAAGRHVRFDYAAIAEYYAHATPEVQRLMEASALVIVDFGAAVEGGFVRMSQALRAVQFGGEHGAT